MLLDDRHGRAADAMKDEKGWGAFGQQFRLAGGSTDADNEKLRLICWNAGKVADL